MSSSFWIMEPSSKGRARRAPIGYSETANCALRAARDAKVRCPTMTPEAADFVEKLRHIEQQANAVAADLPPGISKTRALHIVVLAQTLRARLEFGRLAVHKPDAGGEAPA